MSPRRTSHTARARHARIRAREPGDRVADALDRLEAHYNEVRNGTGDTFAVLAAAYDWLRALIKLAAREVDPDGDGWAEEQGMTATLLVADIARDLAAQIRAEAKNL